MLAYEVTLDGEKIATAGMNDWSVMSVIISASRGSIEHGYKPNHTLHIGGLSQDTDSGAYHVRWKAPDLEVGSEILVRVIDCDHPDDPTRRYRSDREVQESPFTEEELREMRYQDYLDLKAEFEK